MPFHQFVGQALWHVLSLKAESWFRGSPGSASCPGEGMDERQRGLAEAV